MKIFIARRKKTKDKKRTISYVVFRIVTHLIKYISVMMRAYVHSNIASRGAEPKKS